MLKSQVLVVSLACIVTWLLTANASWTCLRVCVCSTSSNSSQAITQVACAAANISQIPRGLPSSVVFLDLSSNRLTSLEQGSLGQLPDLLHLRMRSNALDTIADGTFRNLPALQTLDLGDNRLQRLTERTFQGLLNVETLDLSENSLATIDGAFTNMRHLSRLDLRRNNLTTLTRFSLRDLVNLQYLLLGDNRIATVERDAFRSLEKLMYLVLKGNPLAGVERLDIAAPTLNFVDLSDCGLQRLPKGLPSSIRYLQLRRNNITSLRKNAFIGCPYVGILILDENGLTSIENKTFIHMTYLQQLWLNGNQLTVIPSLLPSSIQRLYLDGNKVTSLTDVFPANSQIDTLSLMSNAIQSVASEALRRLPKLRSLDLSNNRISELRGHTFSKSTQLRRLVLSKNPLQTFHHHSLRGLRSLRFLALAHISGDPTQPPGLFADLRQLRTLDLTNSPGLIQIFLQTAFAKESSKPSTATTLAPTATSLIEELNLSGSQLTHIDRGTFDAFPALKTMQLSSTRFHCDATMTWLRDWLRTTRVHVDDRAAIVCFSPRHLYLQPIISLRDEEFALATPSASAGPPIKTTLTSNVDQSPEDLTASGDGTDSNYDDNEGESDSLDDIIPRDELINDELIDPGELDLGSYASTTVGNLLPVLPDMTTPTKVRPSSIVSSTLASNFKSTTRNNANSIPLGGEHEIGDKDKNIDDGIIDGDDWDWDKNEKVEKDHADFESTNVTSLLEPVKSASSSHTTSAIIVALTALATLGTAAFLIFLIVRLSKKQSKQRSANSVHANGNGHQSNGSSPIVKFSKKSNGLYVTGRPVNDYGPDPTTATLPRSVASGSSRDVHNIHNTEALLSESMTLIPGRDINHEGPLRVYKWEEF